VIVGFCEHGWYAWSGLVIGATECSHRSTQIVTAHTQARRRTMHISIRIVFVAMFFFLPNLDGKKQQNP
jgi:hypothetical protein